MYGPTSHHRRGRAGLWFAAFTIASLLMLLASSTEPARTLQQVTTRALDPVRSAIGGLLQLAGVHPVGPVPECEPGGRCATLVPTVAAPNRPGAGAEDASRGD